MPASFSSWAPSLTVCPPIQAASTGLWACAATCPTARAVPVGSVIACGVRITSTASTPPSCSTISNALAEAVRRSVAQDVDRVAVRPEGGQALVELLLRLLGDLCASLPSRGDQGVGGHHARAAGIGDDRQPLALGRLLPGQKLGTLEHVLDLEDSLDARPLKCRRIDRVDAGHRARCARPPPPPIR